MNNRTKLFQVLAFSIAILCCLAGNVSGQTTKKVYSIKAVPADNSVQALSARIASMYKADALTVEAFVQAAVSLEERTGISAPVVIAIAIHESSFNSELFLHSGNPFGIKASKPWAGPTYTKMHDGEDTKFRVYDTPEAAILDFGSFVQSRAWYADALACPMDQYQCEINGLMKSSTELGYSQDPNWGEAVRGIIEKIGLETLVVR